MREELQEAFGYKVGDVVLTKYGVWPTQERTIESIIRDGFRGGHTTFHYLGNYRDPSSTLFDENGNILAGLNIFRDRAEYEASCLRITKIQQIIGYSSRCTDDQLDALLEYCKAT